MTRPFRRTPPDFFTLDEAARAERWRTLPELAKKIIWLRELVDASMEELADMLNLPVRRLKAMAGPHGRADVETAAKIDALLERWVPDASYFQKGGRMA